MPPPGSRAAAMSWASAALTKLLERVPRGPLKSRPPHLAVAIWRVGLRVPRADAVELQANWPDYVFQRSYRLPPLEEVCQFIQINKRLPGIPSAETVAKDGINVNDMTTALLEKVEELTLYLIQERENAKDLNTRIAALEQMIRDNVQLKR